MHLIRFSFTYAVIKADICNYSSESITMAAVDQEQAGKGSVQGDVHTNRDRK